MHSVLWGKCLWYLSIWSVQWIFSLPLFFPPLFLPMISLIGGLLVLDVWCFIYALAPYTLSYPLLIPMINLPIFPLNWLHPSLINMFLARYYLFHHFLESLQCLLLCGGRYTNLGITTYAFLASEDLAELTTIYPVCDLSPSLLNQLMSHQDMTNIWHLVRSVPCSIQLAVMRHLISDFVQESKIA